MMFNDELISAISGLSKLQSLILHHFSSNDYEVPQLKSLSRLNLLTSLDVSGFDLGTALHFNTGLVHLTVTTISENTWNNAECFSTLCNLESLSLMFSHSINHSGRSFRALTKLKKLEIFRINIDYALFSVLSALPHLTSLTPNLFASICVNSSIQYINQLSNLRELEIESDYATKLVPGSFPRLRVLRFNTATSRDVLCDAKKKFPHARVKMARMHRLSPISFLKEWCGEL